MFCIIVNGGSLVVIVSVDKRGQLVVPLEFRKKMGLVNGGVLAMELNTGMMVAERIKTPSSEELLRKWDDLTKELNKRAKKLGIREEDVQNIIHKRRGVKD